MNQTIPIQRLTDHIRRIETEIAAIRRELKALPEKPGQQPSVNMTIPHTFVNKGALKEQMRQLFLALAIQGEPVGAKTLQKRMRETDLTSNELSRSIIAAREE